MRKFNLIFSFLFCSLASLIALRQLDYPLTGIDDANIYFVYARNLADGHGFVYNIGGERVEGFTSLLWTLIGALGFKFFVYPELTLLIINLVIVSLGIAYALEYLQGQVLSEQEWGNKFFWSAVFLTLIFTSPRYIVWNTVTLMENALWSTLLLVTALFVTREPLSFQKMNAGFVTLAVLLLLTRPESILWVAVFAAILFVRIRSKGHMANALRILTPSLVGIGITFVLLTIFRLQYFGYALPNTYYAKVSPSFAYNLEQGVIYLSKYFISDPIVLLSITAIFISLVHTLGRVFSNQTEFYGTSFLPIIGGVGLLAPLLTGGDHFGSFRLYQNIYPIEILCLVYFAHRILPEYMKPFERAPAHRWQQKYLGFILIFIFAAAVFQSQFYAWNSVSSELSVEFKVADYGRKNGAFIQALFSPLEKLPSLGVVTSGGIKYSYTGEIIDLMGLNNTIMAHNPGDRKGIKNHAAFDIQTFYQLQPDIVWPVTIDEGTWKYSEAEIRKGWENTKGLKGLFDEPSFQESYTYAKVSAKSGKGYALVAWFKKNFLNDLAASDNLLVEVYQYSP